MEFFKISKINLSNCFFSPNQTHVFHAKRVVFILVGVLAIIQFLLLIFLETDNATEGVISGLFIVTTAGIVISFIDTALKTMKIFSLIDSCVKILKKSKHCQLGILSIGFFMFDGKLL